jgi:putative membrane protein
MQSLRTLPLIIVFLFGIGSAQQRSTADTPPDQTAKAPGEQDKKFMKDAAIGNAAEIQLGQMAQEKASDPRVKQFGERMVSDHSKADDQLKNIAQTQHVALPTELDPPHQSIKTALSTKTGSEFDKNYMRVMVQEHGKTLQKFEREAAASQDPTVKKFAQSLAPAIQSHLQQAKQIESQIGANK